MFVAVCKKHDQFLHGQPSVFSEGNSHQIDLSECYCPTYINGTEGFKGEFCNGTWVVQIAPDSYKRIASAPMTSDEKYLLTALRMYGDMLSECVVDKALTDEERKGFEGDSSEVERLIKLYDRD